MCKRAKSVMPVTDVVGSGELVLVHSKGGTMPQIEFRVVGTTKWRAGLVEDHAGMQNPLTFNGNSATETVASGGTAWFSFYARGEPGTALTAEILKSGQPLVTKRNYKIDPDGALARAIEFDPDKA